jgi:Flp pilus assembly protein CpaB
VEREVGPLVPVLAARADIAAGAKLDAAHLAVRNVPQRFVPPDAFATATEVVGLRARTAVPAGGYLTEGAVDTGHGEARDPGALGSGERALEVSVAGGQGLAGAGAGTRVDVLVTTERRSFLALEDVELLGLREGAEQKSLATLRVSLRQAVYLTASQAFAREIRLLPRPGGEPRGAGSPSVSAPASENRGFTRSRAGEALPTKRTEALPSGSGPNRTE